MPEDPVSIAVDYAAERGMADLSGVRAVAHRITTGAWDGSYHPGEESDRGRERLTDLYKSVVVDALKSNQEASTMLAKSGRTERLTFKANVTSQIRPIFKEDGRFIIWGPASVEVVDKEGDRIAAKALEKALPQLLKRARLSVEHTDQLVGDILESFETEETVEVEINGQTFKRDTFPTAVMELDGLPPSLYVCGEVYDDSNYARQVRKDIEDGIINSYSISGEALVTKTSIEDGNVIDDILEMDLSAVTLCEVGMNQLASFAVVAKNDGETDDAGEDRLRLSDVADVAKSAIKNHQMTDLSKEDLIKTFEQVLQDYGVVSKDEMAAYVQEHAAPVEPVEAPAPEVETPEPVEAEPVEAEPTTEQEVSEPEAVGKDAEKHARLMAEKYDLDPEEVLALLEGAETPDDVEGETDPEAEADASEEEPVEVDPDDADPEADVEVDVEEPEVAPDVELDVDPAEAEMGAFGEETGSHVYGPDDLREKLPEDVWDVVSQYLAEGGEEKATDDSMSPEADADASEETGGEPEFGKSDPAEVLKHELNKHIPAASGSVAPASGDVKPAHEGTLEKGPSVADTILSQFYD